jgi:hypothetical protein
MSAQRVILVTASRLLGEMLRRVIDRSDHLEMVQQVHSEKVFPHAIEQTEAEWMILSLNSHKTFPGWVDQYLSKHPSTGCLAILTGKNKVRLKWLDQEEELEDLTLQELMYILEAHPQRV